MARIVFFGSGPVAAASLEGILDDFEVELVITKPRPAHHRDPAPVEELAKARGLDLAFADSKLDVDKVLENRELKSEVGLIIDYGVIVSSFAIESFPKGIINSHFSLLPRWRGADPITYCLLEGDKETGVSLMKIVPKLEEGPVIAQENLPLPDKINVLELTDKLIRLSNSMIKKYLPAYVAAKLEANPQSESGVTYSHKIKKSDGVIDWNKPAERIEREIRAYAGWPKSRTALKDIDCIITEAEVIDETGKAGDFHLTSALLVIFAGEKALKINRIQPAGKKEMSVEEFLRGYALKLS